MKMSCEITSTAHHFGGEKRDISLLTTLNCTLSTFADQNASFFPSKHHFVCNLFHFLSYNHSKGTFPVVFYWIFHTKALKISDDIPHGNESNFHLKNEVCIPHASLLFNLWKPESESTFLLITDVLLLAALSQCLWLCPGFQHISRCSAYPTSFGFPLPAALFCDTLTYS